VTPTSVKCRSAAHGRIRGATERGAALIMSLVILLILTILGVSALGTSTLEEKMAGSVQELTKAFEAAESGANSAMTTTGAMDLNTATTNNFSYNSGKSGSATVVTTFIQYSPPKRGSGYSAQTQVANFAIESTGNTDAKAKVIIEQGVGQVMPK
jgi:type IV pilus assembly protein PilX